MKVTNVTREALRCRRERRALARAGYEEVGERGGQLWELYRGFRYDQIITDVKIAPERKSVFIKVQPRSQVTGDRTINAPLS